MLGRLVRGREMSFWARTTRKSRKEKIRIQKITETIDINYNFRKTTEERKLRWDLYRMTEDRILGKIVGWNTVDRKRKEKAGLAKLLKKNIYRIGNDWRNKISLD